MQNSGLAHSIGWGTQAHWDFLSQQFALPYHSGSESLNSIQRSPNYQGKIKTCDFKGKQTADGFLDKKSEKF